MQCSNGGGGMDIQPSYRSHHIGIGPGLEEGIDGESLAAEWVDSVPELIKKSQTPKTKNTNGLPTLRIQHGRTDMCLHTISILAILPLFARIVT